MHYANSDLKIRNLLKSMNTDCRLKALMLFNKTTSSGKEFQGSHTLEAKKCFRASIQDTFIVSLYELPRDLRSDSVKP